MTVKLYKLVCITFVMTVFSFLLACTVSSLEEFPAVITDESSYITVNITGEGMVMIEGANETLSLKNPITGFGTIEKDIIFCAQQSRLW